MTTIVIGREQELGAIESFWPRSPTALARWCSRDAVAEANERAGVPFARIVAAITVPVAPDGP